MRRITRRIVASLLTVAAVASPAVAQQTCSPLFLGSGVALPSPPVVVTTQVTPGHHAAGTCPNGYCTFAFTVDVEVWSAAGGQTFEVCFNPPVPPLCVPYNIPVDPAKPAVTQLMSQGFSVGVQCGQVQHIELQLIQLLGPLPIVTIDMTCGTGC